MDYENLIEHLRMHLGTYKKDFENFNCGMCALDCANAATAIETLRAGLARVTAERDAAVECIDKIQQARDFTCPAYVVDQILEEWRDLKARDQDGHR